MDIWSNKKNCIWDYSDMATKRKHEDKNWFSLIAAQNDVIRNNYVESPEKTIIRKRILNVGYVGMKRLIAKQTNAINWPKRTTKADITGWEKWFSGEYERIKF